MIWFWKVMVRKLLWILFFCFFCLMWLLILLRNLLVCGLWLIIWMYLVFVDVVLVFLCKILMSVWEWVMRGLWKLWYLILMVLKFVLMFCWFGLMRFSLMLCCCRKLNLLMRIFCVNFLRIVVIMLKFLDKRVLMVWLFCWNFCLRMWFVVCLENLRMSKFVGLKWLWWWICWFVFVIFICLMVIWCRVWNMIINCVGWCGFRFVLKSCWWLRNFFWW